ncbi:MAG: methyltransferase domain-containing protein [Leptospiraceae bacterium]|nr:methyltransferase domain-containing protein [Leptospiraceae bacterium]
MLQPPKEGNAAWDRHYGREKSRQSYPDENLVRLLGAIEPGPALDFGCGSGRHLVLLSELGFGPLYGADASAAARELSKESVFEARVLTPEQVRDQIAPGTLSVAIVWGVLHYNSAEVQSELLALLAAKLSPEAPLLGTLRSKNDTHYTTNSDISAAPIQFFDEREARDLLRQHFQEVELGYIERTPIGQLDRRICHWFFRARNPVASGAAA